MVHHDGIIRLRAVEPGDVDFLYELENDRKLWHITQTLVPFSRYDLEQYVFSADKQDLFSVKQIRLIIEYTRETLPVGAIDLFDLDVQNRRAGVGIVLVESQREKGFAEIALDLFVDYTFKQLNLHQLYCNVEEGNKHSLSLFLKHDFVVVGLKQEWNIKEGSWVGEYLLQRINRS